MKKNLILSFCSLLLVGLIIISCKKSDVVADDALKVYGLTEQVDGKSYTDLDQAAIMWEFGTDIAKGPLDDADGSRSAASFQPLANVTILATNLGGISTRSLTIPSGKPVFFQIAGSTNWYYDNDKCDPDSKPAAGQTPEAFLSQFIDPVINGVKNLSAQLDGKELVTDLTKYKVSTKAFSFSPSKDFNNPACDYSNQMATMVDKSYSLLIQIPKGKHVLHYKADFPDAGDFHTEMIWNLTVE